MKKSFEEDTPRKEVIEGLCVMTQVCILCFGFCLQASPEHKESIYEDVRDPSVKSVRLFSHLLTTQNIMLPCSMWIVETDQCAAQRHVALRCRDNLVSECRDRRKTALTS